MSLWFLSLLAATTIPLLLKLKQPLILPISSNIPPTSCTHTYWRAQHTWNCVTVQSIPARRSTPNCQQIWVALYSKARKLAGYGRNWNWSYVPSGSCETIARLTESFKNHIRAWTVQRNAQGRKVDWQFTSKDARIKLKRLYPVIL